MNYSVLPDWSFCIEKNFVLGLESTLCNLGPYTTFKVLDKVFLNMDLPVGK